MSIDRDKVQQAAQKYVEKKRYDKAILEYERLVQADPNDARTLLKIGDLHAKLGAFAEAAAVYDKVGTHYANTGFALKAIAVYNQIRELTTRHAPHLEDRYTHIAPRLADLFQQLGIISSAVGALEEAANRLAQKGQHNEALPYFQKIVELDPSNPLTRIRLAEAYSRVQNIDGAVKEFGLAANQLIKIGREGDAIKVLERSLHHKLDPEQCRLAAQYYVDRNTREDGLRALSKLQALFQQDTRNLDTLRLLSRAFTLIGQANKAIEVQKEMARIARDSGDLSQFQSIIDNLERIAPNDEVVRRLRGQLDSAHEQSAAPAPEMEIDEVEVDDDELIDAEPSLPPPAVTPQPPAVQAPPPARPRMETAPAREEQRLDEVVSDDARASELLAEATSFSRLRMHDRAADTLYIAVSIAPNRIDVNEALRDELLRLQRVDEALEAMMRIASVHVEALDAEAAAETLQDVLAYAPQHQRALDMLHALGFEVVPDDEPLPAYPLAAEPAYAAPADPAPLAPLPQFGLDEVEMTRHGVAPPAPAPERRQNFSTTIEVTLEQVDHYLSLGMLPHARQLLEDELRRYSHNALLLERMDELRVLEQHSSAVQPHPEAHEAHGFDLDQSLDALGLEEAPSPENYQVDVDEIFQQFKEGVATQIGLDDSQAHYDLGVAYKEMGLLDDAIREFEVAARDPHRTSVCYSLIGMVELDRGNLHGALEAFLHGLQSAQLTPQEELVLSYDAGSLYETQRMRHEAMQMYQRAAAIDPRYRGVGLKLEQLQQHSLRSGALRGSMPDANEVDDALDDMLSSQRS